MKKNGQCKACGKPDRLVDSHIIPKSFYRYMQQGDKRPVVIVAHDDDSFPAKSPQGLYDQFLCADCEKIFMEWDDHAAKILLCDPALESYLYAGDKPVSYTIHDYDYELLKRFFLSVLWRASVCERAEFEPINLGPHENRILELLKNNDLIDPLEYPVILRRYLDEFGKFSFRSPSRPKKIEARNFNTIRMAGFEVIIQTDKRPPTERFVQICLKPKSPFYVMITSISEAEYEMLVKCSRKLKFNQ